MKITFRPDNNLPFLFVLLIVPFFSIGQSPCIDGYAGIYPCENIDLVYHVTSADIGGAPTNEVWGWTDSFDSTEYVLLGASTGVYFFDISNPSSPLMLGHLPTHTVNSNWRTFRTYQDYLFVCSEASQHGMQVFDLTRLRDVSSPPEVFTEDAHYDGFTSCHTLAICEETGYAYACGTNTYTGGLHIVNIQDPLNPVIAGGYDQNGSTHESFVTVYDGPDEDYVGHTIAFCFNGSVPLPITIVDVTEPSDATTISLTTYPDKRYCHQGWITEDGGYLLIDDELDEYYDFVDSTHTIIFDIHNLDSIQYMGYFAGGVAIDHNQIIVGNLCYQSNYTDGLSVLDVTHVADTSLTQVAYFDHYPANDNQVFQGEWMSYPYFESGIIPVTDIYQGMFLLRPDFIHATAPDTICSNQVLNVSMELLAGFNGPYVVEIFGLPEGVTASYEEFQPAPSSQMITFNGLLNVLSQLVIEIRISGASHAYTETVAVEVIHPASWYADTDQDGYGITTTVIESCDQPAGFVALTGDCDPFDATIFPGANGTYDNVDNDCNGFIEEDEIQACSDLNGDHIITVIDVQWLIGDLNCTGGDCLADINGDGMTGLSDLLILMADFGEECP